MPRFARIVVPGGPHHVTQRGNRRQETFFSEADYRAYTDLLAEWGALHDVAIWAYCLMPNHVHLVAVPARPDSLHQALREIHRRYTRRVNRAHGWTGHLWQGQFASVPMDDAHLAEAVRYVELNPVRAGLARRPEDWRWSSAVHHLGIRHDSWISAHPLQAAYPDWRAYLERAPDAAAVDVLRARERTGRPAGDDAFLERLEAATGRRLQPGKPGRRAGAGPFSPNAAPEN
jgi:putative transposase